MKYCIGCEHFYFEAPNPDSCMGSTLTGPYGGNNAELMCKKGHWSVYVDSDTGILDLETGMKHAETCRDYAERVLPAE